MVPVIREPSCFKLKYVLRTYPSLLGSANTQFPLTSAAAQAPTQTSNQRNATVGPTLCLQPEDSFHQQPLLTRLGLWKRLLIFPHQPFPFLNARIFEIGLCLRFQ